MKQRFQAQASLLINPGWLPRPHLIAAGERLFSDTLSIDGIVFTPL